MDDLHIGPKIKDIKLNRALNTVEIVVKPCLRTDKQRRGHARQRQGARQFPLKGVLCQLNRDFRLHNIKLGK